MTIILYDLSCTNNRRPSPFCWRVKYALAHKSLEFETVPVKFTEVATHLEGKFTTVPTIIDNGKVINGSNAIVEYINHEYRQNPLIIEDSDLVQTASLDEWQMNDILPNLFKIYALDIYNGAFPEDQDYFRTSREKDLNCTLEQAAIGRDIALDSVREKLNRLRRIIATRPFLCGDKPNYADYIIISSFLWVASVSTLPLLTADDPLLEWITRCQDLFNGLGYSSTLNPLSE